MLGPVALSEILSRFVLKKDWYRSPDNSVKYAAFLPNPKNGETSVFRISGISDKEVWDIDNREVAKDPKRPILGRADISASNAVAKGLEILPSEPPERHANIVGWPGEKSEQKLIALELAAEAHFHRRVDVPVLPSV
jgi:hypothetical protein